MREETRLSEDECHSRWIVVKILAVYIATFLSLVD